MLRRDFLRRIFIAGSTAIIAPTTLVQVAVGFNTKPDGTIEHRGSPLQMGPFDLQTTDFRLRPLLMMKVAAVNLRTTEWGEIIEEPVDHVLLAEALAHFNRTQLSNEAIMRQILLSPLTKDGELHV